MAHVAVLAFEPAGRTLLAARNGEVRVHDRETGRMTRELLGHIGEVVACAFLPRGDRLVSASHDGTLRVWRLDDGSSVVLADPD